MAVRGVMDEVKIVTGVMACWSRRKKEKWEKMKEKLWLMGLLSGIRGDARV